MKMGSSIFWGLILIAIGLIYIINIVFNIDLPIFKIVIAFVFIYIGIRILVGSDHKIFGGHRTKNDVVFGESNFYSTKSGNDYNVVFGKGTFDFRNIELQPEGPTKIKIDAVFGGAQIFLKRETPVKVIIDAAFAGAQMPNGNSAAFGSTVYTSDNLDETKPYLEIKADVVFGGLKIITF